MGIFDLFSKRQKRLRGEIPDVYVYDEIPNELRVQIVHIWMDSLGNDTQYFDGHTKVKEIYKFIVDTLCREYGLFELPNTKKFRNRMYMEELVNFFLQEEELEKIIDVIELSFKAINRLTRDYSYIHKHNAAYVADQAIDELNNRFKEHGIGYQFVENEIIRVDSELLHVETVKPALKLLSEKIYKGAQEEYLTAYKHYQNGRNKESLNDCLKSFESTMMAICDKQGWIYPKEATANKLIQICLDNELISSFWQSQLTSLQSLLTSSIPTGRNKLGGHGQGSNSVEVPTYLVAYMLHMTASTLVFLIEAEKELKT